MLHVGTLLPVVTVDDDDDCVVGCLSKIESNVADGGGIFAMIAD